MTLFFVSDFSVQVFDIGIFLSTFNEAQGTVAGQLRPVRGWQVKFLRKWVAFFHERHDLGNYWGWWWAGRGPSPLRAEDPQVLSSRDPSHPLLSPSHLRLSFLWATWPMGLWTSQGFIKKKKKINPNFCHHQVLTGKTFEKPFHQKTEVITKWLTMNSHALFLCWHDAADVPLAGKLGSLSQGERKWKLTMASWSQQDGQPLTAFENVNNLCTVTQLRRDGSWHPTQRFRSQPDPWFNHHAMLPLRLWSEFNIAQKETSICCVAPSPVYGFLRHRPWCLRKGCLWQPGNLPLLLGWVRSPKYRKIPKTLTYQREIPLSRLYLEDQCPLSDKKL